MGGGAASPHTYTATRRPAAPPRTHAPRGRPGSVPLPVSRQPQARKITEPTPPGRSRTRTCTRAYAPRRRKAPRHRHGRCRWTRPRHRSSAGQRTDVRHRHRPTRPLVRTTAGWRHPTGLRVSHTWDRTIGDGTRPDEAAGNRDGNEGERGCPTPDPRPPRAVIAEAPPSSLHLRPSRRRARPPHPATTQRCARSSHRRASPQMGVRGGQSTRRTVGSYPCPQPMSRTRAGGVPHARAARRSTSCPSYESWNLASSRGRVTCPCSESGRRPRACAQRRSATR